MLLHSLTHTHTLKVEEMFPWWFHMSDLEKDTYCAVILFLWVEWNVFSSHRSPWPEPGPEGRWLEPVSSPLASRSSPSHPWDPAWCPPGWWVSRGSGAVPPGTTRGSKRAGTCQFFWREPDKAWSWWMTVMNRNVMVVVVRGDKAFYFYFSLNFQIKSKTVLYCCTPLKGDVSFPEIFTERCSLKYWLPSRALNTSPPSACCLHFPPQHRDVMLNANANELSDHLHCTKHNVSMLAKAMWSPSPTPLAFFSSLNRF